MSNENDINFLLGDRIGTGRASNAVFDSEYRQRQVDYTVPIHISEFESSSDKWVRNNLRGNNPFSVDVGNNYEESRYTLDSSGEIVDKLDQSSIFTNMNSSDLANSNNDTRTLDYKLGEINNGIIRQTLSQEEIDRQIDIHNKQINIHSNPYQNAIHKLSASDLLKGIQEINHLSNTFFSELNISAINDAIIAKIGKNSNILIPSQINNSLFIIMRSFYLQHSQNMSNNDILSEIKYLNKLVINYCVDKIQSELIAYNRYKNDIEFLPNPMDFPENTNSWRNYTYDFTELI